MKCDDCTEEPDIINSECLCRKGNCRKCHSQGIVCSCGKVYCHSCRKGKVKRCFRCHQRICKPHAVKKWRLLKGPGWICATDCRQKSPKS